MGVLLYCCCISSFFFARSRVSLNRNREKKNNAQFCTWKSANGAAIVKMTLMKCTQARSCTVDAIWMMHSNTYTRRIVDEFQLFTAALINIICSDRAQFILMIIKLKRNLPVFFFGKIDRLRTRHQNELNEQVQITLSTPSSFHQNSSQWINEWFIDFDFWRDREQHHTHTHWLTVNLPTYKSKKKKN